MLSAMAFAYNYFNISKNDIQGDINVGKFIISNLQTKITKN